jgi:di/tricarboxylate transporter
VFARRLAHTIAAFLVGSALAALVLVFILPAPPSQMSNLGNTGPLMVLSLVGPILFVWAWGPSPLGTLGLLAAVVVPVASIATLVLGYFRGNSYAALVCAALIWSIFGGFAAFLAATGSI